MITRCVTISVRVCAFTSGKCIALNCDFHTQLTIFISILQHNNNGVLGLTDSVLRQYDMNMFTLRYEYVYLPLSFHFYIIFINFLSGSGTQPSFITIIETCFSVIVAAPFVLLSIDPKKMSLQQSLCDRIRSKRLIRGSFIFIDYNNVIMGAMASQITSLTIVYSTVYSGADQRKHQSSASIASVRGIHRWPVLLFVLCLCHWSSIVGRFMKPCGAFT